MHCFRVLGSNLLNEYNYGEIYVAWGSSMCLTLLVWGGGSL